MTSFWRLAATKTSVVPLLSVTVAAFLCPAPPQTKQRSQCDAATQPVAAEKLSDASEVIAPVEKKQKEGMRPEAVGVYYGFFPARQLWQPKLEYPLWDKNWDGRQPASTGDPEEDRRVLRHMRKTGVTRHIILIRHGQYDETYKEDEKRVLTPLGREQAHLTGKRLAEMMQGAEGNFGPCNIKSVKVSGLARARETAEIIAEHLPGVEVEEPDPMINEGRYVSTGIQAASRLQLKSIFFH